MYGLHGIIAIMDVLPYLFVAVVGLVSGVLSGVSGGGGSMLMMPALVLIGLPPQVAVATNKMNGLGAAFGGLSVFRKSGHIRTDILKVMLPLAVLVGVTTPFIFSAISSAIFQVLLGAILILMVPTLFIKKKTVRQPSSRHRLAGYAAYAGVLTLQALFSSGVGMLALFVLTLLFGTSKLEANATKRAVNGVLTPITFVALLLGGYVSLGYGLVGFVAVFAGTHVGSKLALRKGERFISLGMAVVILIAGVLLIAGA